MCFEVLRNFIDKNMTTEKSVGNEKSDLCGIGKKGKVNFLHELVPTTRVLRSHKRKLVQPELDNGRRTVRKRRKSSGFLDTSDCIVLSDTNSKNSYPYFKAPVTSTPNSRDRQKPSDECVISTIKPAQNTQSNNSTADVIIISDTSTPALSVIVLSDGEESDIEVISSGKHETENSVVQGKSNEESVIEKKEKPHTTAVNEEQLKNLQITSFPNTMMKSTALSQMKFRNPNIRGRNKAGGRSGKKKKKKRSSPSQTCKVGENCYLDKPLVVPNTGLRPIIIDGSNVAFHHSNNLYFSCRGLEICIKYFKNRGHEVIAFVPQYRVQYRECDNPKLLDYLVKNGDVILTPSRMVNGNWIVPYDDRFIVQTAVIKGGIIVTRDNYRDLLAENPSWAQTIKYRLLQFTWVQDLLMFPNDPLGKRGPSLEKFLRFNSGY